MRIFLTTALIFIWSVGMAAATPFTMTVPGTSIQLPADYPEAGGVAIVMVGANGNLYFQFSNPQGAFRGFQNSGNPGRFRGNPFTINDPIELDCGFSSCTDYFGGSIAEVHVRFSAYDGDTQNGGFDFNDISLILNGYDIGNWSGRPTQATNNAGTQLFSNGIGFGNGTFDTGWFSSTNSALLNNILTTGRTTTQVYDDDPNDNYWDFRRGSNLSNGAIQTVAPGYTLEKEADRATFAAVGETITYTYTITNIGSVPINDLSVSDDKIGAVTNCTKTTINDTPGGSGQAPDFAVCTATYQVTQEDFDAQQVSNVASAIGTPSHGTLGALSDTVTVTGPAAAPSLFVDKTSTLTAFGAAGSAVPYAILIRNDGNVTLSNISVNDPLLPGLVCAPPDLAPTESFTCTGSYTVQQSDVDGFAANPANTLDNTVTVTADTPLSGPLTQSDALALPGSAPVVTMALTKTAQTASFDAVGDVLTYLIAIENTGNVTWPAAPAITDVLTGGATCPAGPVAPGNSVICSASYTVDQDDINAGVVDNEASASITIGGLTASDSDTAQVTGVRTVGMTLDKRLAASAPANFNAAGVALRYEYVLSNTGNVELLSPVVTDDKVAVTCPASTIAPMSQMICTSADYLTTQADINAGGVTNIASATATEAGPVPAAVNTGSDTVTVPAVRAPAITLAKTAPTVDAAGFQVGETVTYSYTVTNTGNVEISAATLGVSEVTITDDKIGTFSCFATPLGVGQSLSCTEDYVLTATDIAAGIVINTATAAAGPTTSAQVSATIAPALAPAITLVKTSTTASVDATSDRIDYSFEVTNSGDTQILLGANPIRINDALLSAPASCAQPAQLDPGESFICSGYRTGVTQAELDSGSIDNSATASFDVRIFDAASGQVITTTITSDASDASVPVSAAPAVEIDKQGPANFTAVGQVLSYDFVVTNTGNVTLTSAQVTDPLIPSLACTLGALAPNASQSCTGSYVVTQADMDAEVINNTASVAAQPTLGAQVSDTDTASAVPAAGVATQSASFEKTASAPSYAAVGEQITYTLAVSNTGTQTLSNLSVADGLDPAFSCTIASLAPGVTDSSCQFQVTVDQADIDAGSIVNSASVSSAEIATLTDTVTVTGPARVASYTFDKRSDGDFVAVGETVNYTFVVTNTGTVTLSAIEITDPFFGSPVSCTIASLAPGATDQSCTAAYQITQPDFDAGQISNTASISAEAPSGVTAPADQSDTEVSAGPAEDASVAVVKSATDGAFTGVGDSETYTFEVTNDGNVTLSNLVLNDARLGFSCALPELAPGDSTTLCADGVTALSAAKSFTQADVDAGSFSNTVTVTGQSKVGGTAVEAEDSVVVQGPAHAPALSLVKTSTLATDMDTDGQSIPYEYVVTNSGNITLTGPITVSDDKIASVSCPATPAAGLAPGAALTCTGTYRVTLADLNAGQVVNEATATTNQPVIPANPGDPAVAEVTSNTATETVTAQQLPALTLDKRVKSTSPSSYGALGDTVVFEYVVTNSGNVSTTAPITLSDDKIAGAHSCTTDLLDPGESRTCELTWTADQPALDAGEVTNIAVASTVFGGANVDSASDSATVTAIQTPQLAVEKTFISTSSPGNFNLGDVLQYAYVVENTGNVTIDGPITLSDNLIAFPVDFTCAALAGNALAPGGTWSCTASHVVTQNDLDLGAATNVVSATGSFDGTPVVSPSDDAIYPINAQPAISLTKTIVPNDAPQSDGTEAFDSTTDVVTYQYTITNTGNVGLIEAITINDDKIGNSLACKPSVADGAQPLSTSAGATPSFFCQHTYTLTQADLDSEQVVNNATAVTTYAAAGTSPTTVVSPNANASLPLVDDPELTVLKEMTTALIDAAEAGDALSYRITTTNTGNQTISGVAVSDPLIPALSCQYQPSGGALVAAPANVVLAPDDVLICTGTYTVQQSDVDAQVLENTATARGADPQGATINETDTHAQPLVTPVTAMEVIKSITPEPGPDNAFVTTDQEVTFVASVENTGNITLNSITITDDRLVAPASCSIGPLAPGEIDTSCRFVYTTTQADIDALNTDGTDVYGGFLNTITAEATPNNPALPVFEEEGEVFVRGPDHEPQLTLNKESATTEIDTWNQLVTYTYTVANTGNITLTEEPQITDDKIGTFTCAGMPLGGLAPLEFYSCTNTYRVTQDDLDSGGVTNVATATSSEVPTEDSNTATLTIPAAQTTGLELTKLATPDSGYGQGDTISYSYTVTNTGNVSLSDVTVSDQHTSASGTAALTLGAEALTSDAQEQNTSTDAAANNGVWSLLKPGDVVTFTASYAVTQADVDAQAALTNVATVTATGPAGTDDPTDQASESVTPETKTPSLAVSKTASTAALSTPAVLGETVSFEIQVDNTGNQTLGSVVLSDTLTDAKGGALSLSAGPTLSSGDTDGDGLLDVDEIWVYTASFDLTQQAIDAGGVSNTAAVTAADPQGSPVTDTVDTPATASFGEEPKLALVKTSAVNDGGDGSVDAGDTITYTYTVSNTGNQTLYDVAVTETGFAGAGTVPVPAYVSGGSDLGGSAGALDLPVGTGTMVFQATYTLVQADIDAASVSNQATATADDPDGTEVSDLSDESGTGDGDNDATETTFARQPALQVEKRLDASGVATPAAVGNPVVFTISVENTGNQTLSDPVLTDTLSDADGGALTLGAPAFASGDTDSDGAFDVGETWVYTVTYALEQAAIDAGGLSNTVLAEASDDGGTTVRDVSDDDAGASDGNGDGDAGNDPTVLSIAGAPSLDVQKRADASAVSTPAVVGEVISFSITVENDGNQTLSAPVLSDTLSDANGAALTMAAPAYASGDTDSNGALDVGEIWVYAASFALDQQAIDAGGVSNTVSVSANDPGGAAVTDVSDDDGGASDGSGDGDAGNDPTTVSLGGDPELALVKTSAVNDGGDGSVDTGDTITYTYTVSNTGNQTLFDVAVSETGFGGSGTTPVPTYASGGVHIGGDASVIDLPVGAGTAVFTATYTLTQDDVDAGAVSNQATATANDPSGAEVSDLSDESGAGEGDNDATVTSFTRSPALQTVKTATPSLSSPVAVGDPIYYTITLGNIGNVSISSPQVSDTLTDAEGAPLTLSAGPTLEGGDLDGDGKLDPGETWSWGARFDLTQQAIDAGGVSNTATGSGTDPEGAPVSDVSDDSGDLASDSDPTVTTLPEAPRMAVVKTSSLDLGADGIATVGDVITYTYSVSNQGNVTLFDIALSETAFGGSGTAPLPARSSGGELLGGDAGTYDLAVGGAPLVFTASYALTQVDIDAGGVSNQATATAQTPRGTPVSDVSDDDSTADGAEDPTQTSIPRVPGLEVVKTADLSALASPVVAGNQITFDIVVTNTGNTSLSAVTLSDTFTRRDGTALSLTPALISGDGGTAGVLEVGEVWTYRATHTLSLADINAGGVQNQARVDAEDPAGTAVSDTSDDGDDGDGNSSDDPTVVTVAPAPAITFEKRLAAGAINPFNAVGQDIAYEFVVVNTGNITLTAPIQISDAAIDAQALGGITCPAPPLVPGATAVCTGSYRITQAELDAGTFTNSASAAIAQPVVPANPGDPVLVTVTAPSDDAVVTGVQSPELTTTKRIAASSASTFDAVGDQISYDFTVTNTGNVTIAGPITLDDDLIGTDLACVAGPLAPGDQVSCTHSWSATQQALNDGEAINTASAVGSFDGSDVRSDEVQATATAVQDISLAFEKTLVSAVPDLFDVGTVLSYKFEVTNDGNVTIDGPITITDTLAADASCPALAGGVLEPTQSVTCTGSYTLTAGDLALGSTTNTASAAGSFDAAPVTSNSDDALYPVDVTPALTLAKDSVPSDVTFAALGEQITYSYTVSNTSNAGFTEDIVVTDNRIAAPFVCHDASEDGVLSVGAAATCEAVYTVTQEDLDRGFVTNEATAATTFAPGTPNEVSVITPAAEKTVDAVPAPSLALVKELVAPPAEAEEGDVLTYRITASNDGNQTLAGVTISDPMLPVLSCTVDGLAAPANVVLAPGEALVCEGSYTVALADIEAGTLVNEASVRGADPSGEDVTDTAEVPAVLAAGMPELTVSKAIVPSPAPDAAVFEKAGDVIQFRLTARNSGNVTLNSVIVSDARATVPASCALGSLAPGVENSSCLVSYTVQQADVDAVNGPAGDPFGGFTNVVNGSAVAQTPGTEEIDARAELFVRGPEHAPAFALEKTADLSEVQAAGDVIAYTYVITNAGNITLYDQPRIADDKIANVTCAPIAAAGLLPGGTLSCSASYEVTQADIDAGEITNIARASSDEVPLPASPGDETDTVTVPAISNPQMSFSKLADATSGLRLRQSVLYTYTVTNTGNETLTDVTVSDSHSSSSGTVALSVAGDRLESDSAPGGDSTDAVAGDGVWSRLAPGDTVVFTASYVVTQGDLDAQEAITNTASLSARTPSGAEVTRSASESVLPEAAAPELTAIKTASTAGLSSPPVAGEVIAYAISVENTGNQTLDTVSIQDSLKRNDGSTITPAPLLTATGGDGGIAGVMEVGEVWTYSAQHVLTQADIDAGGVSNQVLARALSPDATLVSDLSDDDVPGNGENDPAVVTVPASPAIEGVKRLTAGEAVLNSRLEFTFEVTNTGNVTLRDVAIASDTLTRADGTVITPAPAPVFLTADQGSLRGTLLPGETATYQAAHILTQADIDAGGIRNTALVTGTPPRGPVVTDVTDDGLDGDGNTEDDQTELLIAPAPELTLLKALADGTPPEFDRVGQALNYVFTATNTGNVTLTAPVTITDQLITDAGGSISCPLFPAGGLLPDQAYVCSASYTVTQGDLDAGFIDNTATAQSGTVRSDPSSTRINANQMPAMVLEKTVEPLTSAEFFVGRVVAYTYTVTNTGNTTIADPITITDNRIAAADISCPVFPAEGIAPTHSYVCTANYTVTSDDVRIGSVTNVATATDGVTTSPIDSATTPDDGVPALAMTKTVPAGTSFDAVGDTLPYSFTVVNTGSVTFAAPVIVRDTLIGDVTCFTPSGGDPDFRVGEVASCSGIYTVDQADLDRGYVLNEAYAETLFGADDTPVTSPSTDVRVQAERLRALTLDKSAASLPVTAVGQELTYTLVAQNLGNQTLRSVRITDPMLSGFSCIAETLAPQAVLSCDGSYVVQQSDIDAGTLSNTAEVNGSTPQGETVSGSDTLVIDMPAAAPGLALTKSALPDPFGVVGSTLTYRMRVENTGNVTLSDLVVTDSMDGAFECTIDTLAPGAVDTSCLYMRTVSQADVDLGELENSAAVTGTLPGGVDTVSARDTIETSGPARLPSLEATKRVLPAAPVAGQRVSYVMTVANTGNVTLDAISITDRMQTLSGASVALDVPFALTSGDVDGDNRLDVGEVWTYEASRVLRQSDLNAGGLSNQVTVDARDPRGLPVSDLSDDGDDSDGDTTGDPTIFENTVEPELTVAKRVITAGSRVGDTVVFEIAAQNTGSQDLTALNVSDAMTNLDGDAIAVTPVAVNVPATLSPGQIALWRVNHVLTQADVDAGGLSNSASVTARDPDGDRVVDLSADEDLNDGNTEDDPTLMEIAPDAGLEVIKTALSAGSQTGETVEYQITVRNTGNVSVFGISVADTVTDLDGANARALAASFVSADGTPASPEGTLASGETATYTAVLSLELSDINAGGVSNTALVTGRTPDGLDVSDQSDDDGTGDSDPTVTAIAQSASLNIGKTASDAEPLFPYVFRTTFTISVVNTGNATQSGIDVRDDLAAFAGPATLMTDAYPIEMVLSGFDGAVPNPNYDGVTDTALLSGDPSLDPGQTGTITFDVVYGTFTGQPNNNTATVQSLQAATAIEAEATPRITDTDGDGVPDGLESTTADRDGDGIPDAEDYDPTGYFYCEEDGRILAGGRITVTGAGFTQVGVGRSGPINIVRDGTNGFFQFFMTAPGTYTLRLDYPRFGVPSTNRRTLGTLDATTLLPANPASLGSNEFRNTGVLADFSAGANPFYTVFTVEAGDPFILNNNIPLMSCQDQREVVASKVADRNTAVFGETVNYTLTFRNDSALTFTNARIVDLLPKGLLYTPGTARLNGAAVEPAISGQRMSWTTTLGPNATQTVTFAARVGSRGFFGNLTNQTWMQHATGRIVSNIAEADVQITPEHVFDCSDVIGKVFNDTNQNGYQDGAQRGAITDDDVYVGKGAVAPAQGSGIAEPGIKGAKLVTPDGRIITTDAHGRFSVPCAALPKTIGSNFMLKLDTRSLPTGFRVTTENPRVIRLTPGKMAKMNFGAALSRVVDIDLSAKAFQSGKAAPKPALPRAVDGLIEQIRHKPSHLRLTYVLARGEDPALARQRLRGMERLIKEKWRGRGTYKLVIEKTVARAR